MHDFRYFLTIIPSDCYQSFQYTIESYWLYNSLAFAEMVRRTLEQILSKPKRPLNPYFKMRLQMLQNLPSDLNKPLIINRQWRNIDPLKKAQMNEQYQQQKKVYRQQMKLWRVTSYDGNQTIRSNSSLIEGSQNSREDYVSSRSMVRSIVRNRSISQGLSRSYIDINHQDIFYFEDFEDAEIENHLLEIKRLVKKKEKRWKKERECLLNQIRAEKLRSKKFQTQFKRAKISLLTTIEEYQPVKLQTQ